MKRLLTTVAVLVAASAMARAHTLEGVVKDNKTGEPLIGTTIEVKGMATVKTTSGLDGS